MGYTLPLFNVEIEKEGVMFNPSFFFEIASHNSFSILFWPINFYYSLELIGTKFTPFDFQYFLSLEPSDTKGAIDQCFGIQLINDAMDFSFSMSVEVIECNFGIFGALIAKDYSDCYWTTYDLAPFFEYHLLNMLDTSYEIFPWTCNFETSYEIKEEIIESDNRGYGEEYFATDDD